MIFPATDFIIETFSDSAEDVDRGDKFLDYATHGVEEYWIIDPENETVEKYLRKENYYELFEKLHKGSISSQVIDGFERNF